MDTITGWNRDLYLYHRLRGGVYTGSWNADWPAQLALSREDMDVLVRGEIFWANRYEQTARVRILVPLELERIYTLTISGRSAVNRGLNLLQREDFGCPEVSRERRIRTNETDFTARALRDSGWRDSLTACPDCSLEVRPVLGGQPGEHVLSVQVLQDILNGIGEPEYYYEDDAAGLLKLLEQGKVPRRNDFVDNLDRAVELAVHTVRALRTWRM